MNNYCTDRSRVIKQDRSTFLGEKLVLNNDESELDNLLIQLKSSELEKSYSDSSKFLPKQHFFKSKASIENSKLFKILKKLPKGCSLHTHLLSSVSNDFVIKDLTYDQNCYGKTINEVFKIKFMNPDEATRDGWTSLSDLRKKDSNFDYWLDTKLGLSVENPGESYPSLEIVWKKFKQTFNTIYDMLCYKPAFEKYYYQSLTELMDDNIMYGEFRATIMPLYDLKGTKYEDEDFLECMLQVEERFKRDHKNFIGAKYIHSIYRGISVDNLKKDLANILDLKKKFNELIIGLDFVGFEEEGQTLEELHPELKLLGDSLPFFFHAGESSWYEHTDMNLVDAILMKSKRIGHGFALFKHPYLMDLLMQQDIAVELCPISNQVLLLNDDHRNHPATVLMSRGFPVVICNDDPSSWNATGLSFDWYVVFLAMTPKTCGLKFLKQVALNSIKYSVMGGEKTAVMELWNNHWNKFVSETLKNLTLPS